MVFLPLGTSWQMFQRPLGQAGGVTEHRAPVLLLCLCLHSCSGPHRTLLTTFHHSSLPFQVFGSHGPNHKLACSPSSISHRTVNPSVLYHDLCSRVWVKWDFKMEKVRLDVIIPSLRTPHCLSLLGSLSLPTCFSCLLSSLTGQGTTLKFLLLHCARYLSFFFVSVSHVWTSSRPFLSQPGGQEVSTSSSQ